MRRPPTPHTTVPPETYELRRAGWHEDRRLEMTVPLLPTQPGGLIVELGCGTGRWLSRLAKYDHDHDFLGVDIDAPLIAHAQRHYARRGVSFEVGDLTRAWRHRPAQLLVSVDVLHHVDDTEALYRAAHGHLEPGAAWLIFEPNVWHPAVSLSQERMKRAGLGEDHFRPWREVPRLRAAGFAVALPRYMLAAPQAAKPPERFDRALRWIERLPIAGSSVALVVRAR